METRLLEIIAHLEQVKYAPPEDEITREHVSAALREAYSALREMWIPVSLEAEAAH